MTRIELISNLLCPYTQRAAIQLTEKGLPYERTYIDLAAKPAWFAPLSPLGKVPVLRVGDEALFDHHRLAVDEAGTLGAVLQGTAGDRRDVVLVVLAEVAGVGERDGALVAHPGDRDRGVETPREGDADALADGQGLEDLRHGLHPIERAVRPPARLRAGGCGGDPGRHAGERMPGRGVSARISAVRRRLRDVNAHINRTGPPGARAGVAPPARRVTGMLSLTI